MARLAGGNEVHATRRWFGTLAGLLTMALASAGVAGTTVPEPATKLELAPLPGLFVLLCARPKVEKPGRRCEGPSRAGNTS